MKYEIYVCDLCECYFDQLRRKIVNKKGIEQDIKISEFYPMVGVRLEGHRRHICNICVPNNSWEIEDNE